mmetsp:Transcript_35597/g.100062  ORF Transcript_35597/g.100062 Transcript_35597/m.100062 type:complete len:220 (+) Transcript_35597:1194-1853(+)
MSSASPNFLPIIMSSSLLQFPRTSSRNLLVASPLAPCTRSIASVRPWKTSGQNRASPTPSISMVPWWVVSAGIFRSSSSPSEDRRRLTQCPPVHLAPQQASSPPTRQRGMPMYCSFSSLPMGSVAMQPVGLGGRALKLLTDPSSTSSRKRLRRTAEYAWEAIAMWRAWIPPIPMPWTKTGVFVSPVIVSSSSRTIVASTVNWENFCRKSMMQVLMRSFL